MTDRQTSRPSPMQMIRARTRDAAKWARLLTFAVAVTLIGSVVYGYHVQAQLDEHLLDMGENLMQYEGALRQDETRVVQLNGEQIRFSTGVTRQSMDEVLDTFETVCTQHDGGVIERFAHLPETIRGHATPQGYRPIMRHDNGQQGYVACLDLRSDDVGLNELRARAMRFQQTTDLSDVGDLRYVFVQETDEPTIRHFVTIWSVGHLRLNHIIPRDGDAPGADLVGVARPPGSRRVLSATEAGDPDAAAMYMGSTMTEWELESFYQHDLASQGWQIIPMAEGSQPVGQRVVTAHRGEGELLFVSLDTDRHGQGMATIAVSR